MEQLTEFVSKSFTSDRLPLLTSSSSLTPAATPLSPPASSFHSFSGLSFFQSQHHAIPFTTATALHSMVDRLNGHHLPAHLTALPFLAPNFHPSHPSHTCPAVDLSVISNKNRDDKSPSLSPGRVEVCSPASVTDVDSRPSLDAVENNSVDGDSDDECGRTSGKERNNH